jgi:hypothetical protein
VAQGFLDTLGVGWGSGALVDGEGLAQVAGRFGEVAVMEVGLAEPFVGAGLLDGASMPRAMASAWVW